MFDHKLFYEGQLASLYYGACAAHDKDHTLGHLSFGSRNQEPPLQAADLLMGEMLRQFEGHTSQVMDLLKQKDSMFLGYAKEEDFKQYFQLVIAEKKARSIDDTKENVT